MKLKSLLLNNISNIIYIGVFHYNWCKVYYQDKHCEIYKISVNKLLKQLNNNSQPTRLYKYHYHSPIRINTTLFSPTMNVKDIDCEYFNLEKIEEHDEYYEHLLANRKILEMAKIRFVEYKRNEILITDRI